MSGRPAQGRLFDDVGRSGTGAVGPIYQGVCKQIRHLFPKDDADAQARKDRLAGTIAQARSLAASLDRVSGHSSAYQAAGMQLAAMHERLDELLRELAPDDGKDAFEVWLEQLNAEEGGATDGAAEASHPAQP
jgi:hypothetical protein